MTTEFCARDKTTSIWVRCDCAKCEVEMARLDTEDMLRFGIANYLRRHDRAIAQRLIVTHRDLIDRMPPLDRKSEVGEVSRAAALILQRAGLLLGEDDA
jgi:hypothetical protein